MTWSPPEAGRLRVRVAVESPSVGLDETTLWTPVAETWAEIVPLAAGERERAGRLAASVSHRVTIRWRDDVGSADRLRLGARIFEIRAAYDPDERRRFLVLLAEEEAR